MAITNHERVGKTMELLKTGLGPYVEREFKSIYKDRAAAEVGKFLGEDRLNAKKVVADCDVAALLKLMWESWNDVFRLTLGPTERSLVNELRDHRNKWAHQQTFTGDDAYRALDSAGRLLTAVSAPQSDDIEKMKTELLRLRFDEQARSEKRKSASTAIESATTNNLKPWREVVTPHKDVASGRYQQAEFAADLWQVHLGEGTDEYKKPVEFFRRTYLTESLKGMLVGAVRRIAEDSGDPVVQLQTNFGGGKTHSMLALYHLFSGTPLTELSGIDEVMQEAEAKTLPTVRRVVLVGNKISPGNPSKKPDGTIVRTLWGELAWQLGGKKAFARIKEDDEKATSPGDVLRELFNEYGPCLILIDEWVAYARQLHDQSDLPAGGFETQFTFAQVLTESAKLAKNCLLVISLPDSDTSGSPHTQAEDMEVGGQRGREALDRLRNVVGRVEASWRPASAEEGFEIVRRRLFEPLTDPTQFKDRDVVARAFADFYRTQHQEFPPECRDIDYEKRLKAAYPIHPEIFDRLYTDWSTLVKFQRTRGVLRLMAAVIHSLWEKGDKNPLILPANISIDDPRVQFELTRYLSDNWVPVIEKDVDGPSSLPLKIDADQSATLGKFQATRRVARAIYSKDGESAAVAAAKAILESRGNTPRLYRNTLVFLAADKGRLQDLDEATRKYLAWESILAEQEQLDLSPLQVKQAETQMAAADGAVAARLPETYQWLLVPVQATPQVQPTWEAIRLSGQDGLAARASKKLKGDELLLTGFAATRLRMELDRIPLWRGDHVAVKQLTEDFARYLYLPRLKNSPILVHAICEGVSLLTWQQDGFAFADSFDEAASRYRGLRAGRLITIADADSPALVVKPDVARKQLDAESVPAGGGAPGGTSTGGSDGGGGGTSGAGGTKQPGSGSQPPETPKQPTRFHGSVELDSTRVGLDASRIANEVIAHLAGLVGATVKVTL